MMNRNNLGRVLRNEGITPIQLSRVTGVSLGIINNVYKDRRTPTPKTKAILIHGLNELSQNEYLPEEIFPSKAKAG